MLPSITPSNELNLRNFVAICHKGTQTSRANLIDNFTTTASGYKDDNDTESLKIFGFSEVVQNSKHLKDNITIIKDVHAEDIHDLNSPSGSVAEDAIANRHKYCREVIKPFLKDYPKDCPISDEQLIRDALDAAEEEPDYAPCFEDNDDNQDSTDILDSPLGSLKGSNRSSVLSKDSKTGDCKKGKHVKSDISRSNLSRNSTSINLKSNMDQQKEGCPEKVRPKGCPTLKSKGKGCPPPIESCEGEASWPPAGPPSICTTKSAEGTSKCKDRIPTVDAKDASSPDKSCEQHGSNMNDIKQKFGLEPDSAIIPSKQKTMIEAHSETISTIKTAVEDFFGKVYQTTKDAVTIIKTESAKHLGRITATKSATNSDIIPQRVHENKSAETMKSFNYYKSTDNPDSKSQSTENDETDEDLGAAGQLVGKLFAKVESTMSLLSDHIDLQKVKSLLTFEDISNRSSPFDKVQTKQEEPVATSTSVPSSVFSAIKTRIVSMFSDAEKENADKSNLSEGSSKESLNEDIQKKKKR